MGPGEPKLITQALKSRKFSLAEPREVPRKRRQGDSKREKDSVVTVVEM